MIMDKNKRLCIDCRIAMKKAYDNYKGLKFEILQCPKCKQGIFTQDLARKAMIKLEAQQLKKEYKKKPIKIGNSLGFTIPKRIVEIFGIKSKTIIKIHPNVEKNKIEISFS